MFYAALGQHTVPDSSKALADLDSAYLDNPAPKAVPGSAYRLSTWVSQFLKCERAESMGVFLIKETQKNVHRGTAVRKTRV